MISEESQNAEAHELFQNINRLCWVILTESLGYPRQHIQEQKSTMTSPNSKCSDPKSSLWYR